MDTSMDGGDESAPSTGAGATSQHSWRLSHQLRGHKSDVKAVHCALLSNKDGSQVREVICSVSRDSTAKVWSREVAARQGWIEGPTFDGGGRYLNAVVVVPGRDDDEDASLLLAGLDGLIRCYPLPFSLLTQSSLSRVTTPAQIIQEHYGNITSLRYHDGVLLSSSWDTTARSYRRDIKGKWHRLHLLKGRESAVWGIEVVDAREGREKYLTASADLFVRLFEGEECKVVWEGHRDVVRDLRLLRRGDEEEEEEEGEQLFASSSNDPPILINSLSPSRRPPGIPTNGGAPLLTLEGHTSIVYSLALLAPPSSSSSSAAKEHHQQPPLLVSSSEDGTVRIWNTNVGDPAAAESEAGSEPGSGSPSSSRLVATIPHPITTIWSVDTLPESGDIVSGGEDGVVRVFTQRQAKGLDDEREEEDGRIGGVTREDLSEYEARCQDVARKTGRLGARGQIIALDLPATHNSSVSAPATHPNPQTTTTPRSKQPHPLTGNLYDYLLPIDISDTQPLLMLGVNRGDDARQVARGFIAEHDLPGVYEEEVVEFVEQVVR